MAAMTTTPTTTPAAMPAVLVLPLLCSLFSEEGTDVALAPSVAERVMTTVLPGASLVTTTGAFVVVEAADVADVEEAAVVDDAAVEEAWDDEAVLEAEPE